jgi:hypothetical protein
MRNMAAEKITELVLRTFDWDEQKNELNRVKHGIDFDDAIEVFYGPNHSSPIGPQR